MNKVFILQDNPYAPKNFSQAEEFGDLEVIFSTHISPTHMGKAMHELRKKLRKATKNDWIIPVGNPGIIAVAGAAFFETTGTLNVLLWDNFSKKYIPVRL